MAQVPKTAAPIAPQPTTSNSRLGSGHRVASHGSSIEELNTAVGLALDAAQYDSGRGGGAGLDSGGQRDGHDSRQEDGFSYGRLFRADSSVFAAIFEGANASAGSPTGGAVQLAGPVSKAINIYENNAKIITGNYTLPGMSLSVRL